MLASAVATAPGRLAALLVPLTFAVMVLGAGPASAHADLLRTTPADGSRLERPPSEVSLTFTEDVDLVTGGLRLLDASGDEVSTPQASVRGSTVHWPMPENLPEGAYVATWRVTSSDSHPLAGAISFGVRVAAGSPQTGQDEAAAPWPVVAARFLGYAGFTVFLGALAFLVLCWPRELAPPRGTAGLVLGGLLVGLAASGLSLLLQGPYVAGLPLRRATDPSLLSSTGDTPFGVWMQVRVVLYLGLLGVVWGERRLTGHVSRWLAVVGAVAIAVTFSGTGHAASGGLWDRVVDSLHVLAAGT